MPLPDDLKRAFDTLKSRLLPYQTLFQYADGKQPTVYSTARLQTAFRNINAHFTQNWCSVVVNATLDRLSLKGFDAESETVNAALDDLWKREHLGLDAYDAHKDALVTGEGFLIAWAEEDGSLSIYHNDPRMCAMFYNRERPKVPEFAAKWWVDTVNHLTLYYPDRLEHYETRSKNMPSAASAFHPSEPPVEPNPFGQIPVFHLRGPGELDNILTLQDAVNKLFADMMVAAEYGAYKQRWIISNSDTSDLKNAPNEIWDIPAGDGQGQASSVGQFDATPLENYLNAIDKLAAAIAIISRTPKHYFYNASGQLSGEALLAMEAPLTKKAEQYQERFGVTWRALAAFLLKLTGAGEVDENTIKPVWKPVGSVQPYTEAQTVQTETGSGIPLITSLRRRGWGEDEIKAMQKDRDEEENAAYQNTPEE